MYSFIADRHGIRRRQLDAEGGPFAGLTVDGNPPVVGPHGFLHDRQAESRPPAGLFGREERLENLCRVIRFDPMPRVGDFDGHAASLMQAATERHRVRECRAKAQRPSVGHRLERILDQMVNGLLHVLTIRLDGWKIRGQFGYASDVLAFALCPE